MKAYHIIRRTLIQGAIKQIFQRFFVGSAKRTVLIMCDIAQPTKNIIKSCM